MNNNDKLIKLIDSTIISISAYKRSFCIIRKRANTNINSGQGYIEVSCMLWGVTVEKALKSLIRFVDNDEVPKSHDLIKLANRLEDGTLGALILLSGYKPHIFWWTLDINKNCFSEWRYMIENGRKITFTAWEDPPVGIIDAAIIMLKNKRDEIKKDNNFRPN